MRRTRPHAVRPISRGAVCPDEPPTRQINPNALHHELLHTTRAGRNAAHVSSPDVQKSATSSMIRAKLLGPAERPTHACHKVRDLM